MAASELWAPKSGWQRLFFYRKESLRTTWTLRLSVVLFLVLGVWATRSFWTLKPGQSLVCQEQFGHSDALLLENFDPDYLVFERAAALQRKGIAEKAFIPVVAGDSEMLNTVWAGFAEVMIRIAHLTNTEVIPVVETEPISLNAADQIRDFLVKEHISSVIVVTPGFRSRRSLLVYSTVLSHAGVAVGCVPVFGLNSVNNWTSTWHGVQDVALQFLKLQYYRFYVLR
jgi:hypothetical protein